MQILHPSIPRMLNLQRVPLKVTLITLFSSLALSYGAHVEGFPLYGIVFFGLLPLIPLIAFEEVWKYKHYGFWAIFSTIMILQLGHLGEHSAQVLQLLIHRGDASKAHGVFGQLDAEHVHFFWDSGVWIGALFLLYRFPKNVWLWVAVAFSSLHQVEHTYLETIYVFHKAAYLHGGQAGVLGKGGIFGSPLNRPYIHYVYNYFVVSAMVIGFWDQTRVAFDEYLREALPDMTNQELVTATQQLHRHVFDPGDVIIRQGEEADRFYILAHGKVEVVEEHPDGSSSLVAILLPGQFFGEMGLLNGGRRTATVKALDHCEVLSLERDRFNSLVEGSTGGKGDVDVEVVHRMAELERINGEVVVAPARRRPLHATVEARNGQQHHVTRNGGPANGNGHRKIGTTPSSGATNGAKTSVAKANGNGHGKIGTTPSNGATNGAKRAVVKANGSASAPSARAQVTRRPRSPKAGA